MARNRNKSRSAELIRAVSSVNRTLVFAVVRTLSLKGQPSLIG